MYISSSIIHPWLLVVLLNVTMWYHVFPTIFPLFVPLLSYILFSCCVPIIVLLTTEKSILPLIMVSHYFPNMFPWFLTHTCHKSPAPAAVAAVFPPSFAWCTGGKPCEGGHFSSISMAMETHLAIRPAVKLYGGIWRYGYIYICVCVYHDNIHSYYSQ